MDEDELRYLLRLLDGSEETICEELIKQYNDIVEQSKCDIFSEDIQIFFKNNLKCNPVTTSNILSYFQQNVDETNRNIIQHLYKEVLKEELLENSTIDKFISYSSLLKLEDRYVPQFTEEILKHVSRDVYKQYRKQILISLIPQERPELLKVTSQFMHDSEWANTFKLTPAFLLELCYIEKTHWLLKGAQIFKQQLHELKNVTFNINNFTKQILLMVVIDLTNSPETYDLPSLVHQLSNAFSILDTYTTNDEHLKYYMIEVRRELAIIKFCLENNCKILTTSIFSQILNSSALTTISQLCRLSKVDRYKITRLLNSNFDTVQELFKLCNPNMNVDQVNVNWDILTYNSYCAVKKTIDTIMSSSEHLEEVSTSLEEIKRIVISIQPACHCIEALENIFACLFIRYEYVSWDDLVQDSPCGAHSDCSYFYSKKQTKTKHSTNSLAAGFISNALTTQVILNMLKSCLESLESKMNETWPSNALAKHKSLLNAVNHALWKLQLVSTLSPESGLPQMKLCLEYGEVEASSDDDDEDRYNNIQHKYNTAYRRKRPKRRMTYQKGTNGEHVMFTSSISANDEGYVTTKGSNIDFISLMLAKPNCLVALSLYHNDFPKANQIIDMFDLADGEIATEVEFTEKFRQLIAKIKNIIFYKDGTRYASKELSTLSVVSTEVMGLVESFLAANRAPNSFDIMELADRHPHLQLYSHKNAPFINAVDILLSSGLNRDITYGLINVVERKLAEVRSNTDVSAVKKSNYIRFIEDIASVTFEIFGSTDKSFDFVDNICDLINDCKIPIKHKEFCKLNMLSKELRKSCEELIDVVNIRDAETTLDQMTLQKYHQVYMNVVAASDKDICNIGDIHWHSNKKARTHYLRMCYMYCKTVAQLEQTDNRSSDSALDSPYFSILEKPLHDIFGNMIKSKDMPITALEPICKKLNVNLIPKLIMNFCPSIPLSNQKEASEVIFNNLLQVVYDFKNTEENLFLDPIANFAPIPSTPDSQCLTYVVLHNWVLAHIVKKIHYSETDSQSQQSIDTRTKFINNYMELERFEYLKVLFDNNKYLASLHTIVDLEKLFEYMPKLVGSGKIMKCLNIIDALTENQLLRSASLMNLRDLLLFKLALNTRVENNWKYTEHLKCSELKADLILNNLSVWSMEGAVEALNYLKFILDQVAMDDGLYEKCNAWLTRIPLYDQIASILGVSHWYIVYEKSLETREDIIEVLMDSQQYKLCLEWADAHEVSDNMKNLMIISLLKQLFEYTNQATPELIKNLLSRLPVSKAIDVIQDEMSKVRNVEILQVCVEFISENSTDWKAFENIKIGFLIMLEIENNLRPMFWDLIEHPLLMIEQLLMNAKLDLLPNIINKISPSLKKDPAGDNLYYNIKSIEALIISRNAVDALLRFYAEKSLDMKSPRSSYSPPPRHSEDSLLQSIDSINIEMSNKPFVMPEQVPGKEDWVADYSTDKCMLCHTSIFSMIIRRHHCRRCGRLVCHACSRHRMEVPTYPPNIKFRVCDDCFTQTMERKPKSEQDAGILSSHSDSGGSGISCMDWCLSVYGKRNEAVRNEFSYEFTPNVTLCLTIMKMHSINLDYPRFLLDRSDEFARELSSGDDARLVVRARRSLLLAAAELYSRLPSDKKCGSVAEAGASHVARCLAHADSLAALVRHAAKHLISAHNTHPSHIVRSLLEAEKWELALEIATKSGLSRNSVIAAWGKACLKAGCFKQAREKFAHCFKNNPQLNLCPEVVEDCEFGKEASENSVVNRRIQSLRYSERSSSASSLSTDARPRSNPPLLSEIITMLEDMNYPVNQQLLNKAESIKLTNEKLTSMNTSKKKIPVTEPALNIMHSLATIKKIKQGDYSDFQTNTVQPKKSLAQGLLRRNNIHNNEQKFDQFRKLDPFFYKECVYYLANYGSHTANIAFYMKHSDLGEVLRYCCDNSVDKETFAEAVYMECLRKDKVGDLFKSMGDIDSTLEMWGEYITHICRTLENSGRLEALYSVQCYSNQHARASATCARMYSRPVPRSAHFSTLANRSKHLAAALHHLANCMPAPTRQSDQKTFHLYLDKATIDKHMTTISRQIELVKFLSACESANRVTEKVISDVIPSSNEERGKDVKPLTLFGSNSDKLRLITLVLVCGQSVEEGFSLAFGIISENKLDSLIVYTHAAQYFVRDGRFLHVKALAKCVRASKETAASLISDQILEVGVKAVVSVCNSRGQLHDEQAELLIESIQSVSIKISCYLSCRILSTAYILAAKHDRTNDLRRVLQEAERTGNEQIRSACVKRLTNRNIL